MLVFVTTSKASVLKMLEVDQDFAKKVAVPAVSTLRELGSVLHESKSFDGGEISQVMGMVQERTREENVGVGIKTILDSIFEAKAGGQDSNVLETFVDLLVENMNDLRG